MSTLTFSIFTSVLLWVLVGAVLFGASSAAVGAFSYLRKRALLGDALAHASLPGITVAFAVTGSRSSEVLLVGAFLSCMLAYLFIEWVSRRSKLKSDSVLAITLSFFFALGVFHLSHLQNQGSAQQAGLDKLLFGQAAALMPQDLVGLALLSGCIALSLYFLFHRFLLTSFDRPFAQTLGIPLAGYDLVFLVLSVLAIVLGLQLVGVVLMAAMLITPAAAARMWVNTPARFVLLAALFGIISAVSGVLISSAFPKMPTGPWIVLSVSLIFLISVFFGKARGVLWALRDKKSFQKLQAKEDVLRSIFLLQENDPTQAVHAHAILRYRSLSRSKLAQVLSHLHKENLIHIDDDEKVRLTEGGKSLAQQLTRKHRLVESYLTEKAGFPSHRVHDFAERAEHILSEGLEKQVEDEVSTVRHDPHGKEIPK